MASTFSSNKNLELPANGDYVNTWNVVVDSNYTLLDKALGGVTNLNATGASGTTVLTAAQYQPLILSITGTLTANVTYQIPSTVGGEWIVNNATTGAYTVTINSGGAGTSVVVAQGYITSVYSDGTNISRSNTAPYPFAATIVSGVATLTTANIDQFIECTGGPYTLTLPSPIGNGGGPFPIYINTASTITLATPAGVFSGPSGSGANTQALLKTNAQIYLAQSDGTNWIVSASPLIDQNGNITGSGTIKGALVGYNQQTANYSAVASDSGGIIEINSASAVVVTFPSTLPAGFRAMVTRYGAGSVTIAGSGVTLNSRSGAFAITQQYGSASVVLRTSSLAIVDGNI